MARPLHSWSLPVKYPLDTTKLVKKKGQLVKYPYCKASIRDAFQFHASGYTWSSIAKAMKLPYGVLLEHRKRYLKEEAEK